jgi:hypothetical protein
MNSVVLIGRLTADPSPTFDKLAATCADGGRIDLCPASQYIGHRGAGRFPGWPLTVPPYPTGPSDRAREGNHEDHPEAEDHAHPFQPDDRR